MDWSHRTLAALGYGPAGSAQCLSPDACRCPSSPHQTSELHPLRLQWLVSSRQPPTHPQLCRTTLNQPGQLLATGISQAAEFCARTQHVTRIGFVHQRRFAICALALPHVEAKAEKAARCHQPQWACGQGLSPMTLDQRKPALTTSTSTSTLWMCTQWQPSALRAEACGTGME